MHLTLRDVTIQRTIDEVLETMKMRADSYIQEFYLLDNEKLIESFSHASSREEEIFLRYIYEQKKCFGLDFNDLINFAGYIPPAIFSTIIRMSGTNGRTAANMSW